MISRREFLATAAAAIAGALTVGIVKAKKPVPIEDIQAVPLGRLSAQVYPDWSMTVNDAQAQPGPEVRIVYDWMWG